MFNFPTFFYNFACTTYRFTVFYNCSWPTYLVILLKTFDKKSANQNIPFSLQMELLITLNFLIRRFLRAKMLIPFAGETQSLLSLSHLLHLKLRIQFFFICLDQLFSMSEVIKTYHNTFIKHSYTYYLCLNVLTIFLYTASHFQQSAMFVFFLTKLLFE